MKTDIPERPDLQALRAQILEAREAAKSIAGVDPVSLEDLQFHLECSLVAAVRLQAEHRLQFQAVAYH